MLASGPAIPNVIDCQFSDRFFYDVIFTWQFFNEFIAVALTANVNRYNGAPLFLQS